MGAVVAGAGAGVGAVGVGCRRGEERGTALVSSLLLLNGGCFEHGHDFGRLYL